MVLYGKKKLRCHGCGVTSQVDHRKMRHFYLVFNVVALFFGLAMGLTGMYRQWIALIVVWILIMMLIYPFVLKLKAVSDSGKN
jgi:polyferredoxin